MLKEMFPSVYLCVCALSHVGLFVTLWTVAHQAPLSMGFFRQEYWSGLPFPPPRDLPDAGIEPKSPVSPALAGRFFTCWAIGEAAYHYQWIWVVHGVNPWILWCAARLATSVSRHSFPQLLLVLSAGRVQLSVSQELISGKAVAHLRLYRVIGYRSSLYPILDNVGSQLLASIQDNSGDHTSFKILCGID